MFSDLSRDFLIDLAGSAPSRTNSCRLRAGKEQNPQAEACATYWSFRFAFGAEIDAELLAFFVEVAAFEAQGAGRVGHVVMVAAQLGEEHFALEGFEALRQRSGSRRGRRASPLRAAGKASVDFLGA